MSTAAENIQLVKDAINALNPVRSKMRGSQEFIDTVINIRKAFSDLHYELLESVASNGKVVSIEINSILSPLFITRHT